jgi:hypothetical protein
MGVFHAIDGLITPSKQGQFATIANPVMSLKLTTIRWTVGTRQADEWAR